MYKTIIIFIALLACVYSQNVVDLQSGHQTLTKAIPVKIITLTSVSNPSSIISSIQTIRNLKLNVAIGHKFEIKCVIIGPLSIKCQFISSSLFEWDSLEFVYIVSKSAVVRIGSERKTLVNQNTLVSILIPALNPNQQIQPFIFISGINSTRTNFSLLIANQFYEPIPLNPLFAKINFQLLFDGANNQKSDITFSYIVLEFGQDISVEEILDQHYYPTQEDYFIGIRQIIKTNNAAPTFKCISNSKYDQELEFIIQEPKESLITTKMNKFTKCIHFCLQNVVKYNPSESNKYNTQVDPNYNQNKVDEVINTLKCDCQKLNQKNNCPSFRNPQLFQLLFDVDGIAFKSIALPLQPKKNDQKPYDKQSQSEIPFVDPYFPPAKSLPPKNSLSNLCSVIQKTPIYRTKGFNSRRIRQRLNFIECQKDKNNNIANPFIY